MIEKGQKYHKNGHVYTVKSTSQARCIGSIMQITLVDSCGTESVVSALELVGKYSGLPSHTTINNQPL